jgi:outer membrane biosynthesis protein TonB
VTAHADMLNQPERVGRAFWAALALHAALIGGFVASNWLAAHTDTFGAKDAGGGAVGIETVKAIPLPSHGPENHLATDTESEVPQTPTKAEKVKAEKPPPDAVPIKSKTPKKTLADVASEQSHIKKFKELDPYQLTSKSAPALSSPAFAVTGSGRISPGSHNTLGDSFSGYGSQIQQLVASHWHTDTVDPSIRSAQTIIATFDLSRDGSVHNLHILQGSNIPPLDASVERAILDSNPLPALPANFPHNTASVEFYFELKR